MHKRLISFFLVFSFLLSLFSVSAFADDAHQHTFENKREYDLTNLPDDYQIPFTVYEAPCSGGCGYSEYSWNVFGISGKFVDKTGTPALTVYKHYREWFESAYGKNATATKAPSGIGRKDLPGYADDKGSALVDKDGWPTATYTMLLDGYDTSAGVDTVYQHSTSNNGSWFYQTTGSFSGSNGNVSVYGIYDLSSSNNNSVTASLSYYLIAPVSGYYTLNTTSVDASVSMRDINGSYVYGDKYNSRFNAYSRFGKGVSSSYKIIGYIYPKSGLTSWHFSPDSGSKLYFSRGSIIHFLFCITSSYSVSDSNPYESISIKSTAPTLTVQDLSPSQITNNNNITINNNTWNGNIYVDNSNNLTYIYPQYTTINEKNETVTNISNTPIIYNNETKKYYTYDTITNNYYYITYEQPTAPTPSPSPSPAPSESPAPAPTPDPGTTPTPTPKPGGSISTPETGKPGGDTGDTTGILAVLVEIRDNMIQGFLDIKAAFVAGFAELSANFTLAIENLNVNIQNIFNKKFPDQSTPETALPSPTPSPSPAPLDPILPETQNLIIPKMNSNTFTDEHGTWIASGSSKYSNVFDFFYAFDRSTANFWETNVSPSYLQIEIPDPENYYIDGYIMRISKFTNRYAKEWTLQGSDDGKTWDDLDTQKDQNLSDMEEHKYSLTLRKAYKYYRLNMSNYASSMCSLSHFNLLGYDAKDVVTPTPSPTDPPSPTPSPSPAPTGKPDSGGDTNNFWNIFIGGGSDDGTDGDHKGIFWALVSLILALIAFFTNLFAGVAYLFPFLPEGVVMTLNTCLFVVFLFVIIKFIMRSK